jgi:hypothetical protein
VVFAPEAEAWVDALRQDAGTAWAEVAFDTARRAEDEITRTLPPGLNGSASNDDDVKVRLPSRPANAMAWRETWRLIRPMADREDVRRISDWLKQKHNRLPSSEKTVRNIITAGRLGLLDG